MFLPIQVVDTEMRDDNEGSESKCTRYEEGDDAHRPPGLGAVACDRAWHGGIAPPSTMGREVRSDGTECCGDDATSGGVVLDESTLTWLAADGNC